MPFLERRAMEFFLLPVLPLIDTVGAQIQGLWDPRVGFLSVAQIFHGSVLLYLALCLLRRLRFWHGKYTFVLDSCLLLCFIVTFSLFCRLLEGRFTTEDVVCVGQIAYWLVLWPMVIIACEEDVRYPDRMLRGIVIAGVYASLSVIFFYAFLGIEYSGYENVASSSGGWVTSKTLTGPLICTALASIWLFRQDRRLVGWLGFTICIGAVLLTQNRTGQVMMVLCLLWIALWHFFYGRRRHGASWAVAPIILGVLTIAMTMSITGVQGVQTRWKDLQDPDKAGSGRLVFWRAAVGAYVDSDLPGKVLGIGFAGTLDTLEQGVGSRIHTHSDLFDMLLMFGAVGLIGWAVFNLAVVRFLFFSDPTSPAFGYAMAVLLAMLAAGVLTGQMLGPHTMSFYLITLTALVQSDPHKRRTCSMSIR